MDFSSSQGAVLAEIIFLLIRVLYKFFPQTPSVCSNSDYILSIFIYHYKDYYPLKNVIYLFKDIRRSECKFFLVLRIEKKLLGEAGNGSFTYIYYPGGRHTSFFFEMKL